MIEYKKNCIITQKDYNKLYQTIYYFKNRDKLLAHAKRTVQCEDCGQCMPYSSYSYHRDNGKFTLTFDEPKVCFA